MNRLRGSSPLSLCSLRSRRLGTIHWAYLVRDISGDWAKSMRRMGELATAGIPTPVPCVRQY
jgi:hypothetical protein